GKTSAAPSAVACSARTISVVSAMIQPSIGSTATAAWTIQATAPHSTSCPAPVTNRDGLRLRAAPIRSCGAIAPPPPGPAVGPELPPGPRQGGRILATAAPAAHEGDVTLPHLRLGQLVAVLVRAAQEPALGVAHGVGPSHAAGNGSRSSRQHTG